jgi:hypothetical protein
VLIALVAVVGIIAGVLLARPDAASMSPRTGQGGMGPGMLPVDADRISDTCQDRMAASPHRGTEIDAREWCDSMAEWMSDHHMGT